MPEYDGLAESDDDDELVAVEELNLQPIIAQAAQEAVQAVPGGEAEQAEQHTKSTEAADPRADPAVRAVVANVSRLGMHIQRHDPNGWNELIQIVLQGVLLGAQGCTQPVQPAPQPRVAETRGVEFRGAENAAASATRSRRPRNPRGAKDALRSSAESRAGPPSPRGGGGRGRNGAPPRQRSLRAPPPA